MKFIDAEGLAGNKFGALLCLSTLLLRRKQSVQRTYNRIYPPYEILCESILKKALLSQCQSKISGVKVTPCLEIYLFIFSSHGNIIDPARFESKPKKVFSINPLSPMSILLTRQLNTISRNDKIEQFACWVNSNANTQNIKQKLAGRNIHNLNDIETDSYEEIGIVMYSYCKNEACLPMPKVEAISAFIPLASRYL
jgi:hypothetical protein